MFDTSGCGMTEEALVETFTTKLCLVVAAFATRTRHIRQKRLRVRDRVVTRYKTYLISRAVASFRWYASAQKLDAACGAGVHSPT